MITPINSAQPNFRSYNHPNLTKQMHIEKLQNLIKEFEECAKKQPNNTILKNHIENLKKSLKTLLP